MAYTGAVRPDGPSAVRELGELVIRKASVGPMDNNAYLLTCRSSGDQLLVDAAAEPQRLLALVREGSRGGRLGTIVTTHRHADHHGALESLVAVTGAHVACGAPDAAALPVHVTRRLHHGDQQREVDIASGFVGWVPAQRHRGAAHTAARRPPSLAQSPRPDRPRNPRRGRTRHAGPR